MRLVFPIFALSKYLRPKPARNLYPQKQNANHNFKIANRPIIIDIAAFNIKIA
jgi:hypothetical protein